MTHSRTEHDAKKKSVNIRVDPWSSSFPLPQILRVPLPPGNHGIEVVPPVEKNHDEVSGDKRQEAAHGEKVPDAGEMETAHEPGQPPELCGFEEHDAGQRR